MGMIDEIKYQTKYQSIVLMGKIASGKGTQAGEVVKNFGGILYSNGDKVRESAELDTSFGKKIKEVYEAGFLIPEWVASYWMTHALVNQYTEQKLIFEEVAKKPNEAELFHEIHDWIGRPYVVFNLEITDEEVKRRSDVRQRDIVDSPKSVNKRLEEYHTYTTKSIEFFRERGTLIDIDGSLTPSEVQSHIFTFLTS